MDYDIIGHLFTGDELEIVGEDGDWYQVVVKERNGYVHKDYVDVLKQAASDGKTDSDMMAMLLYLMMAGQTGTEKPSVALTPDGNLTLVDDYSEKYADGSGKQFITVTTKDGNYFYLVIDRDDKGNENVHFMNLVDEADLLALMEDSNGNTSVPAPVCTCTEKCEAGKVDTNCAVCRSNMSACTGKEADSEEKPTEPEKTEKKGMNMAPVLVVVLLLGAGGGLAFIKMKNKKQEQQQAKPDPDADYFEDGEEDGIELPDDVEDEEDDSYDDEEVPDEDTEPV